MDNQVPELMLQPDLQLHFLQERLGRKFKDEIEIEAFIQTSNLSLKTKQDILKTVNQVKQIRVNNKRIMDSISIKPKKEVEKIK